VKLLGLTGSIATGKSTTASFLQKLGVPVVDTDILARELVEPGQPALETLRETFGSRFIDPLGRLRRDSLAQLVFTDETARRQLEGILHPRIRAAWKEQVELWRAEDRSIAAVAIPLLFETRAASEFDATLCVACSKATQHRRLRERGLSDTDIERRLSAQLPLQTKMELATHVLWNDASVQILHAQLTRILAGYQQSPILLQAGYP
jgi:dephospho-CoA kinase